MLVLMFMNNPYGLIALLCLVPAVLVQHRRNAHLDNVHWAALLLGAFGPGVAALAHVTAASWSAGLAMALWSSVAVTMALFAMLVWSVAEIWRLSLLLAPYMLAMGVLAALAPNLEETVSAGGAEGWLVLHIIVSVVTYALVTIAAVAALAAALQDRALKAKRPTRLTHVLPSVADCERITARLLGWSEAILGLDLMSGMAVQYGETGQFLVFDHKTVLSILAFAVIGIVLIVQHKTGMRGRKAARSVLLAYLLLSLGYLGVKVVAGGFFL